MALRYFEQQREDPRDRLFQCCSVDPSAEGRRKFKTLIYNEYTSSGAGISGGETAKHPIASTFEGSSLITPTREACHLCRVCSVGEKMVTPWVPNPSCHSRNNVPTGTFPFPHGDDRIRVLSTRPALITFASRQGDRAVMSPE